MPEEDRPSEPHSEFPLPGRWAQAWPIILWGMLAFSLVLIFAESLAELIMSPALRAASAVIALMGVTALIIYRQSLLAKFRNPNPGLTITISCIMILVIALSPFAEQRRWPYAWIPSDTNAQIRRLQKQFDSEHTELLNAQEKIAGLEEQRQANQHSPINRSDTPTWLRLRFDEKGEPTEVASINVHWSWLTMPALSDDFVLDFFESVGSSVKVTTMTTLLFLSFDVPIRPGPISIGPSPASLPRWDPITRVDDRNIIFWFHGQIINRRLEIRIK